jgi:hypothetical protein
MNMVVASFKKQGSYSNDEYADAVLPEFIECA